MRKKVLSVLLLAAVVLSTGCGTSSNESSVVSDSSTTSITDAQNESTLSSDPVMEVTTGTSNSEIEKEETISAPESVIADVPTEETPNVEQESQSQLNPDAQSAEELIAIVDELYNGIKKKTLGEVTDEMAMADYHECNVVKFNGNDSFENFKNYYCSVFQNLMNNP